MRIPRLAELLRATRSEPELSDSEPLPGESYELSWRRALKGRVLVVIAVLGLWGTAIALRLVELHVVRHAELSAMARRNQERVLHPEAHRGEIVDRHGQLLAYSVQADSIAADPSKIERPEETAAALCAALGDCTPRERRELAGKLGGPGEFAYVRRSRSVSPTQTARVAALKLRGVFLLADTGRYYPRYELGAHVLGFVDLDNKGQGGVEYAYDNAVRGKDGLAFVRVDARQQRLESRVERAPVPGAKLELTIDLYLQHILERELKAGVEANRAKSGTAIIMDPASGEILALASYPTFNPNSAGRHSADERRNRAVQDVYEPGSTFKIVTASAALEEGVVKPTDLIDTNPGYITFPGRKPIRDDHHYGVLSFEDVIVKSSNVGAIKAGLRTGVERLSRYVHRFGFGEALAPDFVGQSRGIWNPGSLDESGLASVSMGYQVSVTPLQMATAVSAIANGGLLMEPHVVRAVVRDGRREVVQPKVLRRAITADTAVTMTGIMEGVVSNRGTARRASVEGFQAAGKTGTAKKVVGDRYSDTDYNASFVGFVPSRRPAFTILVMVDTPRSQGYYGGLVAAPIFKRIAEAALQQAGIAPTVSPAPPVLVTNDTPSFPIRPPHTSPLIATLTPVSDVALMPDVGGLSAREATRVLVRAGLVPRMRGDGFVARQSPPAGDPVDPGGLSLIELRRSLEEPPETRGPR